MPFEYWKLKVGDRVLGISSIVKGLVATITAIDEDEQTYSAVFNDESGGSGLTFHQSNWELLTKRPREPSGFAKFMVKHGL